MKNYELVFDYNNKLQRVELLTSDVVLARLSNSNEKNKIENIEDDVIRVTTYFDYTYYYVRSNSDFDCVIEFIRILHSKKEEDGE